MFVYVLDIPLYYRGNKRGPRHNEKEGRERNKSREAEQDRGNTHINTEQDKYCVLALIRLAFLGKEQEVRQISTVNLLYRQCCKRYVGMFPSFQHTCVKLLTTNLSTLEECVFKKTCLSSFDLVTFKFLL